MNFEEAKAIIRAHAGHSEGNRSFYMMLREYRGLKEENFWEILNALRVIAKDAVSSKVVDKELMSALWDIVHFAYAIGLRESGSLKRNKLISDVDARMLLEWTGVIQHVVSNILDELRWIPAQRLSYVFSYAMTRSVKLSCEEWSDVLIEYLDYYENETDVIDISTQIDSLTQVMDVIPNFQGPYTSMLAYLDWAAQKSKYPKVRKTAHDVAARLRLKHSQDNQ